MDLKTSLGQISEGQGTNVGSPTGWRSGKSQVQQFWHLGNNPSVTVWTGRWLFSRMGEGVLRD